MSDLSISLLAGNDLLNVIYPRRTPLGPSKQYSTQPSRHHARYDV